MIYFENEKKYYKIKDVAQRINIDKKKLYECVRDMENHHLTRYKKTAFGSYLVEEEQIRELKEYVMFKGFGLSPKGVAENIRVRREVEKTKGNGKKELDMKWAKDLNYAVWRNF